VTLQELLNRCKCGVFVTVNQHRNYYETAEQSLDSLSTNEWPPQIEPDVRAEMIRTDTIIEIQFYPDTPIGSYSIYHYSLQGALAECATCFANDRPVNSGETNACQ
jgi:hypothetical protein